MKDTAFYEQLLGLKAPWMVKQIDLCLEAQKAIIDVTLDGKQVGADPTDERIRAHIHGWTTREWHYLDTCQF